MIRLALLLCLSLWLSACASTDEQTSAAADPAAGPLEGEPGEVTQAVELARELGLAEMAMTGVEVRDDDYRLGPSDELEIEVFQVEELSTTERVNARGYIHAPLVGNVKVAGLTAHEVEDLLAELYRQDYLQDPQIYVNIVHFASQRVTVIGSVRNPGVYPLTGPTTLLKAMAMAGGTDRIADEKEVVVFRTQDTGEVVGYTTNLAEIQAGIRPDPEIIGNDRIVVDASRTKSFINTVTGGLRGFIGFTPFSPF